MLSIEIEYYQENNEYLKKKKQKKLKIFKINSIDFSFFVFICRASRICCRSLFILCVIIAVFSTRICRNLDLGIEWVFRCKATYALFVSKENNAYVGLTTTTISRQLKMHLIDFSSIALNLKIHSIPKSKSKFQKILIENTTVIAHKINKLWLQILEALHIKTKKT